MFEHPQFTHDRYIQEMRRIDARNEIIRSIRERSDLNAKPRRRWAALFRRRAESIERADARIPDLTAMTVCTGPAASAR